MRGKFLIVSAGVLVAVATQGVGFVSASAPPVTGCAPVACTPGTTVGLTNSKGVPIPGAAGLYAWGMATEPDGSILVGDYWNYRIVHYEADGSQATPFDVTNSTVGFGPNTNQAPFGICVDTSGGPFQGDVYMTEGLRASLTPQLPHMAVWASLLALVGGSIALSMVSLRTFTRRVVT